MAPWNCFSASDFSFTAADMLSRAEGLHVYRLGARRFKALFGVDAEVCEVLWDELDNSRTALGHPVHLLWPLFFIKVYATEEVHATITGSGPKTFRKWAWAFLEAISMLKLVGFDLFSLNTYERKTDSMER